MYLASVLVALIPIFLVFATRRWLGRDGLQPLWVYPLAMLAGGIGGSVFGLVGSRPLEAWFSGLAASEGSPLVLSVLVVPLAEEAGKGLILLLLLRTFWFRSAADGMLLGLAAGAGYAAFENLFYFVAAEAMGGNGAWMAVVSTRLLPSMVIHGGTTALVGAYLGAARWERRPLVVFATFPAALLMATLIHGGWNGLMEIAAAEKGATHALIALGMLPALTAVLSALLWVCLRIERGVLRRELEPALRAGWITRRDFEAVGGRLPRSSRHTELLRAAMGLAFALRQHRLEQRGDGRVTEYRRKVLQVHPHAGSLSHVLATGER